MILYDMIWYVRCANENDNDNDNDNDNESVPVNHDSDNDMIWYMIYDTLYMTYNQRKFGCETSELRTFKNAQRNRSEK